MFFVLELVGGIVTGSLALKSDAFHMASDVIALVIGAAAASMAGKPARSPLSTYGYLRGEVVAGLVNGVFLLAVCFIIFLEALERFANINAVKQALSGRENAVLGIGALGLAFNIIGLFVFHSHSHSHGEHDGHEHGKGKHDDIKHGKATVSDNTADRTDEYFSPDTQQAHEHGHEHSHHQHSLSAGSSHGDDYANSSDGMAEKSACTVSLHKNTPKLKQQPADRHNHSHAHSDEGHTGDDGRNANSHGMFLHVLGDALGSIAVIASALIIKYATGLGDARFYFDPIASVLITCFIAYHTVPFVRSCVYIMLQRAPAWLDVSALTAEVRGRVDCPAQPTIDLPCIYALWAAYTLIATLLHH
jgi:zinc transporter 1